MAKRKRLSPASPAVFGQEAASTSTTRSVPIAEVAGAASAQAALEALSDEMLQAKRDGRMLLDLPLDAINPGHLVRDRLMVEDEDMQALKASLKARGQQTPIEVVDEGQGRYGLISGWRRYTALKALLAETGEARFGTVQALMRSPETASEAYQAMVEENEIRVGLSYYERARVAVKAAEMGVFEDARDAVRSLFASASRAKRSKINSFVEIVRALDGDLRFPTAIPERLGLSLAKALGEGRLGALKKALNSLSEPTLESEIAVLTKESATSRPKPDTASRSVLPKADLKLERVSPTEIRILGSGLTPAAEKALRRALKAHGLQDG